jgi:adenylate cyclase
MERENRRLAAIVAADIASYSLLIEQDEEGTLRALRAHRTELINPLIEHHGGRIANTAGDSLLLEFPSAVEAVRCSIALQEGMSIRNGDIEPEKQISFRIGINVGDVVAQGEDLLGNGVNVAARLEGLAEPGGICISRAARDQVRDRIDVSLEDMGEVEVKNIARRVRVFKVDQHGVPATNSPTSRARRKTTYYVLAVCVVAAVAVVAMWKRPWTTLLEDGSQSSPNVASTKSGPSIAVLPFRNLTSDGEYDALVDGLALELSNRLANLKLMRVIGRSSMSKYKEGRIDPVEIRKSMMDPVDYLLSASLQAASRRVRVFAELLRTKDGSQVWAKTYDGNLPAESLFDFQEEVAQGIATAVAGGYGILAQIDRKKIDQASTTPLSDYECTLLTFLMFEKGITPDTHLDARICWEQIVKHDPKHADAWGWLAALYSYENSNRINMQPEPLVRMLEAAEKAVGIDPTSQVANYGLTIAYFALKREREFLAAANKTLSLDPNNISMIALVAFLLDHSDIKTLSIPLFENAAKLDPFAPFWYFLPLYEDAHKKGEYKKALELSLAHDPPGFIWTHIRQAMYYARLGEKEKAAENVAAILKQQPDFGDTINSQLKSWGSKEDVIKRYVRDLRDAGINIPGDGS